MKKLISISLFLGLFLGQLFAGTTGTVADENGRLYNTAYFDVTPEGEQVILDYVTYSKRASFNAKQILDTTNSIKKYKKSIIHGRIEIPSNIRTKSVYVNFGNRFIDPGAGTYKYIYLNNSKKHISSNYNLTSTKLDKFGNQYVEYKIVFRDNQSTAPGDANFPSGITFTVAPKTRGFKDKFEDAKIYVFEE